MSDALQEQFVESESFKLRRMFPWINLFRSFRLAIGLRVMILGILATLLLAAGEYAISWMPFSPHMNQSNGDDEDENLPRTTWPWQPGFFDGETGRRILNDIVESEPSGSIDFSDMVRVPVIRSTPSIEQMAASPRTVVESSLNSGAVVLWPARTVIEPAAVLFSRDVTWSAAAVAWCKLVWALLVWSTFGVAIARIVVLEFANRESPSLRGSLKYSAQQLPSALGSVILPSVALVGLYLACRIGGWIAYASWLRPIVGALWILDLLCGLGIAIILMLLAAGWPLMVCTMAVDRGDSFEGFTRAFSYVFGRPWYALWLLVLTTLYGSIVFVFLLTVLSSAAHLAETSAGGHAGIDAITAATPPILRDGELPDDEVKLSGRLGGFWLKLWATLIAAFVASFFWSAASISYLLLRRSVDATPIDEVHDGEATQSAGLPLSGMAAAEQREQQLAAGGSQQAGAHSSQGESSPASDANEAEA